MILDATVATAEDCRHFERLGCTVHPTKIVLPAGWATHPTMHSRFKWVRDARGVNRGMLTAGNPDQVVAVDTPGVYYHMAVDPPTLFPATIVPWDELDLGDIRKIADLAAAGTLSDDRGVARRAGQVLAKAKEMLA